VLFGLRHNLSDEVLAEVFGCSQATITRYHEILQPILRWVTRPEVDDQLERAGRDGVLVDGFVAPVGEREHYDGLFSGKKHVSGAERAGHRRSRRPGRGRGRAGQRRPPRRDGVLHLRHRRTLGRASHTSGPGMIGDAGYQGTGPITPHKKTARR
jgi:hypothetical protein